MTDVIIPKCTVSIVHVLDIHVCFQLIATLGFSALQDMILLGLYEPRGHLMYETGNSHVVISLDTMTAVKPIFFLHASFSLDAACYLKWAVYILGLPASWKLFGFLVHAPFRKQI